MMHKLEFCEAGTVEPFSTDERIGYRIIKQEGQYRLLERRLQTTNTPWWHLRYKTRYYTLLLKIVPTWEDAQQLMHAYVAEAQIVVETNNYNLDGKQNIDMY